MYNVSDIQTTNNDSSYVYTYATVEIKGYKNGIDVSVCHKDGAFYYATVKVNNASQNAWGTFFGKKFATVEMAIDAYKGKRQEAIRLAFAAIEEFLASQKEEEVVEEVVEEKEEDGRVAEGAYITEVSVDWQEGDSKAEGTYNSAQEAKEALNGSCITDTDNGGKIGYTITFSDGSVYKCSKAYVNGDDPTTWDVRNLASQYLNHIGTDRWLEFQRTFKRPTDAATVAEMVAMAQSYLVALYAAPVASTEEQVEETPTKPEENVVEATAKTALSNEPAEKTPKPSTSTGTGNARRVYPKVRRRHGWGRGPVGQA